MCVCVLSGSLHGGKKYLGVGDPKSSDRPAGSMQRLELFCLCVGMKLFVAAPVTSDTAGAPSWDEDTALLLSQNKVDEQQKENF